MLLKLGRSALAAAARVPALQGAMLMAHGRIVRGRPWMQPHPFDRQEGTDTGGYVPAWLMPSGRSADRHSTCYAGCQPSCLRAALRAIPDPGRASFIDLGCGKGRALAVASELPFRRIIGLELAPRLARTAQANARIIARAHPDRTPIEAMEGDATLADLPDGDRVVFLYHSFGAELVAAIVRRLLDSAAGRETFFVYENPVHGAVLDRGTGFHRWYAATVRCDTAESGLAPDEEDAVVIWRNGGPDRVAHDGAGRRIMVTKPEWRAELAAA